ncbi:hypothetical protein BT69DRAFT_1315175 [Atractiella rhizophila]|nr:hypothetical protein BT69DRAFT_1315175 [Atractiella rhizophila]
MRLAKISPFGVVALMATTSVMAQDGGVNTTLPGCMSLAGSVMCPRFQDQFLKPSALAAQWPFFSSIDTTSGLSVVSFDSLFRNYLTSQFAIQKIRDELGCSNFNYGNQIQWAQTMICGVFVAGSQDCFNGTSVDHRMTCQSTCYEMSFSELALVNNTNVCPPPALPGSSREKTLTADFVACTNWTSLQTNNTATCIEGSTNEPNCGFGSAMNQLCSYCNPQNHTVLVSECCTRSNVDLSQCNYTIEPSDVRITPSVGPTSPPSQPLYTSSPASTTALTSTALNGTAPGGESSDSSGGLSNAEKIGIALGVTGFTFIVLVALLAVFLRRNKKPYEPEEESEKQQFAQVEPTGTRRSDSTYATPRSNYKPAFAPPPSQIPAGILSIKRPTTAASEDRTIVKAYADKYSHGLITKNTLVRVVYPYEKSLDDELTLKVGDKIKVKTVYDDGWCLGMMLKEGTMEVDEELEGAFPLVCVTIGAKEEEEGRSRQTSFNSAIEDRPTV